MSQMTCIRAFSLAAALQLVATSVVEARVVRNWSYQELLDKSDLVVIATPTANDDTKEKTGLPGFEAQPVVGVETKFAVSAVLKGDKELKDVILHHYRIDGDWVPNGPLLVSFTPSKNETFILFLVKEPDGHYAPTVGQVDPGMNGIKVLERPGQ
jgi:hypothetical protein